MVVKQKLSTIIEGMKIYDVNQEKIGTIDTFRLGEDTAITDKVDNKTIEETFKTIIANNDLVTELNPELYEQGFLCAECGILRDNLIIFPHQIEDIIDDAIYLNVSKEDLLHI